MRVISKDIHDTKYQAVELTAEQKLVSFLVNLSTRNHHLGFSSTHIQLLMQRKDIANYLGMAPETVSRLFKRLVRDELISIEQLDVEILDMESLKKIIGCQ